MHAQLGLLDWGIGGISIYRLVRGLGGIVYFSDTGATPYGKMSRTELAQRLNLVAGFMASKGVTHLVIGCNAASTGIRDMNRDDLVIEGVIDAAVETAAALKPRKIGVIGGRRTVMSGIYRRAFESRGIDVAQRVAQPLSGLIESGDTSSDKLRGECRRILAPLADVSHLLLACTHYPAIAPSIRENLSPDTVLVDPAAAVAERIKSWKLPVTQTPDEFYTTGDAEAMKRAARNAFDVEIGKVVKTQI